MAALSAGIAAMSSPRKVARRKVARHETA